MDSICYFLQQTFIKLILWHTGTRKRTWLRDGIMKIYHLGQGLENDSLQTKSNLQPVLINKLLLEHSHTHVFIY